jgi:hypothetical protein
MSQTKPYTVFSLSDIALGQVWASTKAAALRQAKKMYGNDVSVSRW